MPELFVDHPNARPNYASTITLGAKRRKVAKHVRSPKSLSRCNAILMMVGASETYSMCTHLLTRNYVSFYVLQDTSGIFEYTTE